MRDINSLDYLCAGKNPKQCPKPSLVDSVLKQIDQREKKGVFTDVLAFYVDRSKRLVYGVGAFNTFQQGRDIRFPGAENCRNVVTPTQANPNPSQPACQIFYLQKMFGVMGLASYPLSTFSRVEGTARVQGVSRTLLENGVIDQFGNLTNVPAAAANSIIGVEPNADLSFDYGYDTTRYGPGGADPLAAHSGRNDHADIRDGACGVGALRCSDHRAPAGMEEPSGTPQRTPLGLGAETR